MSLSQPQRGAVNFLCVFRAEPETYNMSLSSYEDQEVTKLELVNFTVPASLHKMQTDSNKAQSVMFHS